MYNCSSSSSLSRLDMYSSSCMPLSYCNSTNFSTNTCVRLTDSLPAFMSTTNTSFLYFCFNFDSFASDKLEVVQFAQASAMIFFDYSEDI